MVDKIQIMKNKLRIVVVLSLIFLNFGILQTNAQNLERKGFLGVQMISAPNKEGIKVLQVFEDSTASNLGLQKDDIILAINNQSFDEVAKLVTVVRKWRQNDEISIKVKRNNETKTLKGKIVGKPLEKSSFAEVTYGYVDYDGGKLRSILEMPKGVKNPPAILFLPGVGCASYDFWSQPNHTVKLLIESIVEKGIAVYRVEKPGMGDSSGTKHCLEMDFDYEVNAFAAALEKLKSIEEINKDKIFLFGESLGSISAPLIATKNEVAGIVAWGGIPTSWFEYYLKLQRKQKVLLGVDYAEMDKNFRKVLPFYYDFLVRKQTPKQLAENPQYKELVRRRFREKETWNGLHHYTYFQNLNDKNVLTAYKTANCPVLAIAGEHDIHAADTDWAEEIVAAVNFYRPGQGKYVVIPKTTHHYYKVPSIKAYNEMRRGGKITSEYMAQNFSQEIAVEINRWIKEKA